jgi:glycosyltransferase involved in cell wall biosynthesis
MKILYVKTWMHDKNHHALMNYKNIDFTTIYSVGEVERYDLSQYDCVLSPQLPIDVSKYPNTKFIFGPHFSIFPDHKLLTIKGNNSVFNLLCNWVVKCWSVSPLTSNLNLITCPFGVDTNKFNKIKPNDDRNEVFVYFKSRQPDELERVKNSLDYKNIKYRIFSYENRYHENEYLHFLQNSKYGIWIGRHESQGFGLEEALSCDVPLLVWDVKSMNQEYGTNYEDIPATSAPYWDERCGEVFYDSSDFENVYDKFIKNIENYKPRDFVLENLSMEICENKLIETINNINV